MGGSGQRECHRRRRRLLPLSIDSFDWPQSSRKRGTAVNPSYDFTGQVALVTGGSSGMGLATAQAFAEAGAAVVLADVNEAALSAAAEALTTAGHQVLGVVCDVSQEDQVEAMIDRAVATFGRLD